ncbi:FAD-dependent monooxygenase [Streptomyces sp. N50]|uniref:FAD-dependent monooxygenase n=1 Tax=Streptomyces sp. N50 TaxID=3081765 RepID=UPI0029621442|nr:FAD-dependent monooxygenase [Streptomyces sp. N50]WOX15145.1 FAD-dependent monooxygenase [Streptomyces sp. N50]
MKIVVVGGGVAGLVTALSLHAAGLTPLVRESARELHAVGVGINLLPHAVRELTELGLGDALDAIALPPERLVYCDRRGRRIWEEPLGLAAGYRWPQYSVHRGKLQMLLLDAVRTRIGPDAVRTGMAFEGFERCERPGHQEPFERQEPGVAAHFVDRRTGAPVVIEADVLVGADGIDSRLRAQLHPGEGPPRGNGVRMWRGMSRYPHILGGRAIVVAGGRPGDKFVAYPVADPAVEGGPTLMNWVLEIRRPESGEGPDRSNRPVPTDEALAGLSGWELPWVDLPELIRGSTDIHEYPMVDRDPLPRWSFGRVTLVGDAAHPMYPMGMNGGSQSIVDARVLAWTLSRHDDPVRALERYESLRREPLNQLVLANRELGPEKIIALAEEIGGPVPVERATAVSQGYKELAGCTTAVLNSRESWSTSPVGR